MRYTGATNRLSRRENVDLGMKTSGTKAHASLLKKINILPGQHGLKRRRKVSERGRQLREKQKVRFMFGLTEKTMQRYFFMATRSKENTAHVFAQLLESRLDNVVYRLGFAPTRAAARQLITHKHITVNDQRVNIPSYRLKVGDVITFSQEKSMKIPYIEASLEKKDAIIPEWIERTKKVGKVATTPSPDAIEKQINMRLVVEYYSK